MKPSHLGEIKVPPRSDVTASIATMFGIAAILALVVTALRLANIWQFGGLVTTTGGEESCIYSVWKLVNGFPLYEDPRVAPFSITLYNYLFYWVYAVGGLVSGGSGQELLLAGRLTSLSIAAVGAAGQYCLVCNLWPSLATQRLKFAVCCAVILVWFGPLVGWWTLSFRPDLLALAMTTWGCWSYSRYLSSRRVVFLVACGLLFFAGWAAKQSVVALAAGTFLHVLGQRDRFRGIAFMILPFVLLAVASLLIGGQEYRMNVIWGPSINDYAVQRMLRTALLAFAAVPFAWLVGPALTLAARPDLSSGLQKGVAQPEKLSFLLLLCLASIALALVTSAKDGSSQNQWLESVLAMSSWGLYVLGTFGPFRSFAVSTVNVSLAPTIMLLALQALFPGGLGGIFSWTTLRVGAEEASSRLMAADIVQNAPRPLFTTDHVLSLPWHSTDGRHPASVLDPVYYNQAKQDGVLAGDGVVGQIHRQEFRSLWLPVNHELVQEARQAGYRETEIRSSVPDAFNTRLQSDYVLLLSFGADVLPKNAD
jgi:hypothetical protein